MAVVDSQGRIQEGGVILAVVEEVVNKIKAAAIVFKAWLLLKLIW